MQKLYVLNPTIGTFTDSLGAISIPFFEAMASEIKQVFEAKDKVLVEMPGPHQIGAAKAQVAKKASGGKSLIELGDGNLGLVQMITAANLAFQKENLLAALFTYNAERDIKKSAAKSSIKSKFDDLLSRHLTTVPVVSEETFEDDENIKLAALLAQLLDAQSVVYMVPRENLERLSALAKKFNESKNQGSLSFLRKSGQIREFLNLLKNKEGVLAKRGPLTDIFQMIAGALDYTHGKQIFTHIIGNDPKSLSKVFKDNEAEFSLVPETVK